MPYTFRYQLSRAPEARIDGSGQIGHDITVVYRLDELEPPSWVVVPGHHKTILVPASELAPVLEMANGAAKIDAYKQLLVDHRNDPSTPYATGWQLDQMEVFMDANMLAIAVSLTADEYIRSVAAGGVYPATFAL